MRICTSIRPKETGQARRAGRRNRLRGGSLHVSHIVSEKPRERESVCTSTTMSAEYKSRWQHTASLAITERGDPNAEKADIQSLFSGLDVGADDSSCGVATRRPGDGE